MHSSLELGWQPQTEGLLCSRLLDPKSAQSPESSFLAGGYGELVNGIDNLDEEEKEEEFIDSGNWRGNHNSLRVTLLPHVFKSAPHP